MTGKTLLISRLATQNAGNEALSKELIRYAAYNLPDQQLLAIDRYPRYFEQFRLDDLGADPVPAFDALVRSLIATFDCGNRAVSAPAATEDRVRLDARGSELNGPLRTLKRKLALRRRLAAHRLIEREAPAQVVTACANADLLIWNPAGEIQPTATSADHVVRLLLLTGIAQAMGRKTAVINHSLEIADERVGRLISHVYGKLDYVGLRDARSVDAALALGIPAAKISESPDLVFLAAQRAGAPVPPGAPEGAIALAINGLEAMIGTDEWAKLMRGLNAWGRPLLFVSNAVNHDRDFARTLAGLAGRGTVIDYQPGYQELRGYYRNCAVLIGSRLHASILALSEDVPVVSIEPSIFKLTAIFRQMDYPIATESVREPGWADRVLANVKRSLSAERAALVARGGEIMSEQIGRIEAAYAPLFALAEPDAAAAAGAIPPATVHFAAA